MVQIITSEELEALEANEVLDAEADDQAAVEPFYSPEAYGLNFGYYAADDELLEEDPLDAVAYAYWLDAKVDME
jgi:hypothetical protein